MYIFVKSTHIKCELKELFAFHENVSNLKLITPKGMEVKLLKEIKTVSQGDIIDIITTKFFLSTFWKIKITKFKYPNTLVDTALESPFKFWEHHHIFRQKEDGCELKDIVFYELPFGIFGKLFSALVSAQLQAMFDFRHRETKKILEFKEI